jgi:hypothetical protein
MRDTIGIITQEGKEMPFTYRVEKKNWPDSLFGKVTLEARLLDNYYLLEKSYKNIKIFPFGITSSKEEADKRLYAAAEKEAIQCDEVQDKTHYAM